jgi:YggT family protein
VSPLATGLGVPAPAGGPHASALTMLAGVPGVPALAGGPGASTALTILANVRTEIAGYLSTLIYVYTLLLILYIVIQLLFAFGVSPPYSRALDAFLTFLRDVCEPYLRIFRRIIPSFGAIDFSPIIAIFVLSLVNVLIVQGVVHG